MSSATQHRLRARPIVPCPLTRQAVLAIALIIACGTACSAVETARAASPKPDVATPKARVPLLDGLDGPNWLVSCAPFSYSYRNGKPFGNYRDILAWKKPGGDWLDAKGVAHGQTAFATARITTSAQTQDVIFEAKALVEKLLQDNTGIYLSASHAAKFASRETGTAPAAKLVVVTSAGTFTPRLVTDIHLINQGWTPQGAQPFLTLPAMLKFDLSEVKGSVKSASLTMKTLSVYSGLPQTYNLFYLDMPAMITDPAAELGGAEGGIAATVAKDSDLARHPDIMFYTQLESPEDIAANWGGGGARTFGTKEGHSYVTWPEFGLTAFRNCVLKGQVVGAAMHKWTQPLGSPKGGGYPIGTNTSAKVGSQWYEKWTRPYEFGKAKGYDELYFRYIMKIDADVSNGCVEGVKLPGLCGTYDWSTSGSYTIPEPLNVGKWYAMMQHGKPASSFPNHFRLWSYYYGADNLWNTGTPPGLRGALRFTDVVLKAGRAYSIEQHIKLNTVNANGVWNHDGVFEVWVDGVKVYNDRKSYFREHISAQIQEAWFQVFHGGTEPAVKDIHHEFSGVAISQKYIGPAKRIGPGK
jgi:hypothetical protein